MICYVQIGLNGRPVEIEITNDNPAVIDAIVAAKGDLLGIPDSLKAVEIATLSGKSLTVDSEAHWGMKIVLDI